DQIGYAIRYGRNWECDQIVSEFDSDERILLNALPWATLPDFYRAEPKPTAEHKWVLAPWVPKKHMLNTRKSRTFRMTINDPEKIHETVRQNNIDRIGIVRLERERKTDRQVEHAIEWLKEHQNYSLIKTVSLTGKTLFIFDADI
ncbi:MAG: hypothetical protein ACOC0A_03900, partial [Planctomycetota bacterium]